MSNGIPDITRLWWDGKRGVAQLDGVTVVLHAAPVLQPLHLQEIDYAPALRVSQLRESAQAWRDMTAAERESAQALLGTIADAAHRAVAAASRT